jgi:hypothetical protein
MKLIRVDRSQLALQRSQLRARLDAALAAERAALQAASRETARRIAAALAVATSPGRSGYLRARASIAADVRRVYLPASRVYAALAAAHGPRPAASFYGAFMRRDYRSARQILRQLGSSHAGIPMGRLDPTLHPRARDASGRVRLSVPLQIVRAEDIAAYLPRAFRRLGKTASGWAACARALGGEDGVPSYKSTRVHGAEGGHVRVEEHRITLVSTRSLARQLISPGQVQLIVQNGRRGLLGTLAGRPRRRRL